MKQVWTGNGVGFAAWILVAAMSATAIAQDREPVSPSLPFGGNLHGPAEPRPVLEPKAAQTVGAVLQSLAARAGVVFVGQVASIKPNGGAMEIVFNVQQPVIGEVGSTYTLREWSGRWAAGQQHYRMGQRAMVFLYAPSPAGFSSPVDGMTGVVPLIPMGADADPLLDVRWLATRVQRPAGAPIADADFGAVALADALAVLTASSNDPLPEPVKRPLPIGLRPRPIERSGEEIGTGQNPGEPSILQQQGGADVEH